MDVTGWQIVGFDGLPVRGAVGRKPALVRNLATGSYAVIANGQPRRLVDDAAIHEAVERGLVTRVLSPLGAWSPDACVAYVDVRFLAGRWGGMMFNPISACSTLIPNAWVWSEPLPDALNRFERWARLFLDSAASLIEGWDTPSAEERFAAVIGAVDRARFCVVAVGDRARELRRRAAVLLTAAYLLHGRFDDPALRRDLALDFNPAELAHIRVEALGAVPSGGRVTPAAVWTDDSDPLIVRRESACI